MLEILQIVLPVFIVIGAGYLAVKVKFFTNKDVDSLMRFVQLFAIPCLLFIATAKLDLAAVFRPQLLISYYLGSIACFVLGIMGARIFFKRRPGESVVIGFGAMFSNTVLLGLPIMERAYGAGSTEPNLAIIAVHVPFGYLLGITTMELLRADGRALHQTAVIVVKSIFSNAMVIGLILGMAFNLLAIPLPGAADVALSMFSRAALPAALFGLGGILVRYSLTERLGEIVMVCVIRLFVHPGIAYVMSHMVFGLSIEFVRGAVIASAMAPGVNAFIFASLYDRAKGTAASVVLIGTIASIFSVSMWLLILGT
jgi:predicted permease